MSHRHHADKLMEMATITRKLKELAVRFNGENPNWEANRQAEIDALEAGAMAICRLVEMIPDNPALYDVAKQVCHEHGMPWTDPRTGITYHPPQKP